MFDDRRRGRIQFHLSYLIYLLTLAALAFAALRRVYDANVGRSFNTVMFVAIVVMSLYFAIRIPILVRRLRERNRVIQSLRAEMERQANSALAAHHERERPPP